LAGGSTSRPADDRPGVLDFLLGWIKALRWQRLPEMDGSVTSSSHIERIAACCDHPVRFLTAQPLYSNR
jgi:hypothetical protein